MVENTIYDSEHPMSWADRMMDMQRVDVTTDSNGAASTTLNWTNSHNYSSGRTWGVWVEASEFSDTKATVVDGTTTDVAIRNAPASTTVTLYVVRMADRGSIN